MDKIVGRTFRNEFVNLDFTDYEKCTFINCTIHADFGIFRLVSNDFSDCKLDLGHPARNMQYWWRISIPTCRYGLRMKKQKSKFCREWKRNCKMKGWSSMDKKLKIIPKPQEGTRTVLVTKAGAGLTFFGDEGDLNLVCGNCGAILCEKMKEGQIRNIVLQCPICRLYNDIP